MKMLIFLLLLALSLTACKNETATHVAQIQADGRTEIAKIEADSQIAIAKMQAETAAKEQFKERQLQIQADEIAEAARHIYNLSLEKIKNETMLSLVSELSPYAFWLFMVSLIVGAIIVVFKMCKEAFIRITEIREEAMTQRFALECLAYSSVTPDEKRRLLSNIQTSSPKRLLRLQ